MSPLTEVQRLLQNIDDSIKGKPWFGQSLYSKLQDINATTACAKPAKLNHNIAEILTHMMAWRQFVLEHLNGNSEYEVWETELDWPQIPTLSEHDWRLLMQDFLNHHELFLSNISHKAESLMDQKLGNRSYTYRTLFNGITQHDIYHIGQISIVINLVKYYK